MLDGSGGLIHDDSGQVRVKTSVSHTGALYHLCNNISKSSASYKEPTVVMVVVSTLIVKVPYVAAKSAVDGVRRWKTTIHSPACRRKAKRAERLTSSKQQSPPTRRSTTPSTSWKHSRSSRSRPLSLPARCVPGLFRLACTKKAAFTIVVVFRLRAGVLSLPRGQKIVQGHPDQPGNVLVQR